MASSPIPSPPPGAEAPPAAAPSTPGASPAPPQPSPGMQQGTQLAIQLVSTARAIAKAFPSCAPEMSKINDLMQQAQAKMMQSVHPGEPQAGPM